MCLGPFLVNVRFLGFCGIEKVVHGHSNHAIVGNQIVEDFVLVGKPFDTNIADRAEEWVFWEDKLAVADHLAGIPFLSGKASHRKFAYANEIEHVAPMAGGNFQILLLIFRWTKFGLDVAAVVHGSETFGAVDKLFIWFRLFLAVCAMSNMANQRVLEQNVAGTSDRVFVVDFTTARNALQMPGKFALVAAHKLAAEATRAIVVGEAGGAMVHGTEEFAAAIHERESVAADK